jgi:hypothetical protein
MILTPFRDASRAGVEQAISGAAFAFQGFRFLLWVDDELPPLGLSGIGLGGEEWEYSTDMYHVHAIKMNEGKFRSVVIEFLW